MILNQFKHNLKSAGFTMIELLIVMGILSVLAVGVLAAIDPVEQLNKSRDTGARSDSKNLLDAVERYYAVKELYPWGTGSVPAFTSSIANLNSSITALTNSGELKTTFAGRIAKYISGAQGLMMYKVGNSDAVWVCFTPSSKSFTEEATSRCLAANRPAGYPGSACTATGGTENRICLP